MKIDWIKTQRNLKAAGYDVGDIDGMPGALTYRGLLSFAAQRQLGDLGLKMGQIYATMVSKYDIDDSCDRLIQFISNTEHETTGYTAFSENLNYTTPARLVKTWPTRFNLASAMLYLRNPKKLAEKVYGGRYGNPPGKAYDYRGGGQIQTTFFDNYLQAEKVTGLPLSRHPELLHDPLTSVEPACAFWKNKGCNGLADEDPTGKAARVRVNGGTNGLIDVRINIKRLARVVVG